MFFDFRQNNSGGSFSYDDKAGIAETVIIEANSAAEANEKAERIGLYFNGAGDCECCGSRWYEVGNYDGTPEPRDFARVVVRGIKSKKRPVTVYIHYSNGRVVPGRMPTGSATNWRDHEVNW